MSAPPGALGVRTGAAALVVCAITLLAVMLVAGALAGASWTTLATSHSGEDGELSSRPSALALEDIPARYLLLYEQAGQRYGIDWSLLAAIGKVECDHGRDPDPSCWRGGAVNGAGAGGPMQFLASTWSTFGLDGDGDGHADRWDPADAIYSAANYLHSSGAPADDAAAIFAYNHAAWYVAAVERWAIRYRSPTMARQAGPGETGGQVVALQEGVRSPTPVAMIAGTEARLDPGDRHLALVPAAAPAVVQAMLVAGNELQGLAYGPAGHPDPLGSSEEDCSSTVNYVLYRSGIRPLSEILRDNPLAQDYTHWGAQGPGRWVSIYATSAPTAHVFAVIAGLRLDTSRDGTDVGPNRSEGGPRWRLFDRIPGWAHWSVRHPPGL
jgi:hypothetical protein